MIYCIVFFDKKVSVNLALVTRASYPILKNYESGILESNESKAIFRTM